MKTMIYQVDGTVGILTLNRPASYNAVNFEMVAELEQFWQARLYDETVRVIIMDGGSAKGFCAGLDLKQFGPEVLTMKPVQAYDAQVRMARLLLLLRTAPQPVIACVHGAAAGMGFSLAMAADVRILAEDARFSAAYINIGLGGADMASSYFLPRLIGSGRANEFLLTGNWMGAQEAMSLGFASRLTTRGEILSTAREIADTMAEKDALGLRLTKEAINVNLDAGGLAAALELENRNQIMAGLAKRLPLS